MLAWLNSNHCLGIQQYSLSFIFYSFINFFFSFSTGTLAIGITANFVNHGTEEEANVQEISGIAYQFNPQFFDNLLEQKGIKLENIVYYKDETHYFVMTAGKASLLKRGALKEVMFEVICFCLCKATMKLFISFLPTLLLRRRREERQKKFFFN